MPSPIQNYIEQNAEEFEDRYVHVDHGPDADDHDCEPDTWNPRFKLMSEEDQIKELRRFHTETLMIVLRMVREMVEKKKVANGNYNCGEDGCCNTNPEDKRELEDVDWQSGYNHALYDILSSLPDIT